MQSPAELSQSAAKRKATHSTLVSRNVTIAGHRTSVRLEPQMWDGLSDICRRERAKLHEICTAVALRKNEDTSLTAAIRVFVMAYFRAAATEDGHTKAGHGYNNAFMGVTKNPTASVSPMSGNVPSSPYMMATGKSGNGSGRY